MPNKKIKIIGIDPGTHKLILDPAGTTIVFTSWTLRKITWEIHYPIVKSILIVGKTPYNPFEEPIPLDFRTEVKLKVRRPQPANTEWEYSIHWKDEGGTIHISDPKISINPTQIHSKGYLILGVATLVLSLFGIYRFLRKKKSGK